MTDIYPSQTREYQRAYAFKRRLAEFGLRREDFDAMVVTQGGLCAICEIPMRSPCIDHSRITGNVRGLLCQACNGGIGLLGDDLASLERAVAYLRAHT